MSKAANAALSTVLTFKALIMLDYLRALFYNRSLSPHGICLLWNPQLIWTHVIADALIGLSYFSIPIALSVFLAKRHDVVLRGVFWCFVVFILACGTTHFMSILTLWVPVYGLEAAIKVVTAAASIITACALWWLMPVALALPTPAAMRAAAESLASSNLERLRAEAANLAKTEFLARMSHEIRTPLSSIVGYTDLVLRSDRLGGQDRQRLEIVQLSANALMGIVDDVLDFSKIEAGQLELQNLEFEIRGLCEDVMSMMRQAAHGKSIQLSCVVKPNVFKYYIGDRNRIRQIILNMTNNAIKFTQTGGVAIEMDAEKLLESGGSVLISVVDTGIGIPAEKEAYLFKPFSQVDGSNSRQFGGTGLGLSICKRIVDTMNGDMGYAPNHPSGATFWVRLPLKGGRNDADAATTKINDTDALRVLFVEDVIINQELGRAFLEADGYATDVASSGLEALEMVQKSRYDVVLMDIQMPIMDGISATREIRALTSDAAFVPIIAVTANVLPDQVSVYRQAGMDDFVAKPFRAVDLGLAINRCLSRRTEMSKIRQP